MTAFALTDNSAANRSAFDLGVFTNQLLWNYDQAVSATSDCHRVAALGLFKRLEAIGAGFTGQRRKRNAKFRNHLDEISKGLPAKLSQSACEQWQDTLSRGQDRIDDRTEGEWWSDEHYLDVTRKRLRQTIIDSVLTTPQQRMWFELGLLIDSGRHRPDVGKYVLKYEWPPVGPHITGTPQTDQDSGNCPNSLWSSTPGPVPEPRAVFRTFESGEQQPQSEWWRQVVHLCQEMGVSCNPEQPDLSTTSLIIDAAEDLIGRVRVALGAPQSDAQVRAANGPVTGDNDSTQTGEGDRGSKEVDASQPDDEKLDPGEGQATGDLQTDSPPEKSVKIGNWEFWPVQVKFKDESRVDLIDLPREIFKRLLSTTNPDVAVYFPTACVE